MNQFDKFWGWFAIVLGVYCLYGYYMLRFKQEINKTILLPRDTTVKQCKDIQSYCKEAQVPLLVLGIVTILYGAADLYTVYMNGTKMISIGMMAVEVVVLILYAARIKKVNDKYFG